MNMFTWLKQQRTNRLNEEKIELERTRMIFENDVMEQTIMMTNSPCAIRNGFDLCTEKCIHFKQGHVKQIVGFYEADDISYLKILPKCKLWR